MKFDHKIIGAIGESILENFIYWASHYKEKRIPKVFLYSDGGAGEAATAIADYVRISKFKMNIYCFGKVESAALIILKSGHRKYAAQNCTFMYHKGVAGNGSFRSNWKHRKKLSMFNKIVSASVGNIRLKSKPIYLSANEALEAKLIDKII